MRNAIVLVALVAALGVLPAPSMAALEPGDRAPAVKVAKWIKGAPVLELGNGDVYVIEFWATWCGPCRMTIPHLTELAKKYAGKVTFAGISVWERGDDYLDRVEKFVQEMGSQMDYAVGADDAQGTMAKTWLEAAGENGIPCAFIVDGTGRVAWIGHPMDKMDAVLDKVLAGTWNVESFKKQRVADKRREAAQMEIAQRVGPLYQAGKYREALKALDEALARTPSLEKDFATGRFVILANLDEKKAHEYALKAARGVLKGDAQALNELAWMIVQPQGQLKKPNYAVGLEIAKMAAAASNNQRPEILDTLALAQYRSGQKAAAVATQQKAVAMAKRQGMDARMVREMEQRLAQFRSGKK